VSLLLVGFTSTEFLEMMLIQLCQLRMERLTIQRMELKDQIHALVIQALEESIIIILPPLVLPIHLEETLVR
jgi:hypothetical protein